MIADVHSYSLQAILLCREIQNDAPLTVRKLSAREADR
jgi:hypothetical protein